jgi:endoplasmic reticulum-Golgi intermediate compartment protein 3
MQETDKIGLHVAHGASGVPGVFFNYEISPILVVHAETRQSFAHFLTSYAPFLFRVCTVLIFF